MHCRVGRKGEFAENPPFRTTRASCTSHHKRLGQGSFSPSAFQATLPRQWRFVNDEGVLSALTNQTCPFCLDDFAPRAMRLQKNAFVVDTPHYLMARLTLDLATTWHLGTPARGEATSANGSFRYAKKDDLKTPLECLETLPEAGARHLKTQPSKEASACRDLVGAGRKRRGNAVEA